MTNRIAQHWLDNGEIRSVDTLGFKASEHQTEAAFYNPKARTFSAVFHTEAVAMDDMVVLTSGMDDSYFRRFGNMYWNHVYDVPVAKLRNLKVSDSRIIGTFQMLGVTQFQRDLYAMMAPDINAINGTSIGFRIDNMREATRADEDMYGSCSAVVTGWRWLETSLTPMPSNPDTLVIGEDGEGIATQSVDRNTLDRLLTRGVIQRSTAEMLGLDTRTKRRTLVVSGVPTPPARRRLVIR